MPTFRFAWLFAVLPLLPAQIPSPPAATAAATPDLATVLRLVPERVPIHDEGVDPELGPLGTWAAGRDYKCGFADGAFVLVPYLGAEAPTAPAWRWQTVAATMGDQDLLGGGELRERHTDYRFERERGFVTERWDVLEHGVEQSFVVAAPAQRPHGELRLCGRIVTSLAAASRGPAATELEFTAADGGYRLTYGVATAIDAAGRRCAVPGSFDGESITLHVPADFVAAAAWPLLVDPLLTPYVITTGSSWAFGDLDLDAIDGDTADQHLAMVWSRAAASGDHDLYVFRASSDFATAAQLGVELTTTASSREGSVTGSWIDRTIAVAWSRSSSVASSCLVKTMAANATGTSLSGAVTLPKPANSSERMPRLAAAKVFDFAPAQALCVRVRDTGTSTELWATVVGTTTNQTYGTFAIALPTLTVHSFTEPWVTKGIRGDYEGWLIAYQYWSVVASRWQVAVRRVDYIGQLDATTVILDANNPSRHLMRPRIDGAFERYTVVCNSAPTAAYPGQLTSFAGTAIEAQRIDWDALGAPVQPWPRQTVLAHSSRSLLADSIAVNTDNLSHWGVGARFGGGARSLLLGYRGAVVEELPLPTPNRTGTHVAQDVMVAFAPQQRRFCALYDHTTNYQGVLTWTCQGIVREYEPVPAPQPYGPSCGLQSLSFWGESRRGNEFLSFGPRSLAPGAWVIAGVSLAGTSVPFASLGVGGGCTLLVDIGAANLLSTVFLTANPAGYAGLQLPIPEDLPPIDLYVQFVAAGASWTDLTASRGVRVFVR
jgi:hypothetical protein